jgi:L-malate glycosyltransferase
MVDAHQAGEQARVLWITAHSGTPSSVRPEVELGRGLAQAGVALRVIAPADSHCARAFAAAGLPVVGSLPRRWFGRRMDDWLREGCRGDGIEIVVLLDRLAVAAALPALRNLPVALVMRHDRTGGVQRWNPFARLSQLHPRINRVVCTFEAAREELARRRDPASVLTIYPGHSLDWYAAPPADLTRFGVPREAFPVAVVGNYRPRKGIEFVIDAAQWLPAAAPVHFLLVGAGLWNRGVLERIARSPLRERIHLLGHRGDAPCITAACAVAMRGAVGREGMPQTIIEAMACGVPPIVTDTGGARELVESGESGIIVRRRSARALGEALVWLLEHPAERRAMGAAARLRIAEHFSLTAAIEQHLQLYRQLRASRETAAAEHL